MSESTSRPMVLRTVYLPPDVDDELRELAFERKVSKGEVIRDFVAEGLRQVRDVAPVRPERRRAGSDGRTVDDREQEAAVSTA